MNLTAGSTLPRPAADGTLLVEPCTRPEEWDAFVASRPDAVLYHQHAWRAVFERAFRRRAFYLAARREGRLSGILPLVEFDSRLFGRFAVSLPFVNYGGVLADDEPSSTALLRTALDLAGSRRWSHVELRHFEQRFAEWPARRHKVAMWLRLPGTAEALWAAVDRKARNQVRKAEKSGLVAVDGGRERLNEFYTVFARHMRDLGTPVYGRRFFDIVFETFPAAARVFVVLLGSEPVAAAIVLRWRDRVEVPWASSLRAHNDKSPNNLLYWSMLQWSISLGAGVFDFGRSTPDAGTYHFKRQWGAEAQPLVWEYAGMTGAPPDLGPSNPRYRMAIAAWQKLPVRIATALGPAVVRNIP